MLGLRGRFPSAQRPVKMVMYSSSGCYAAKRQATSSANADRAGTGADRRPSPSRSSCPAQKTVRGVTPPGQPARIELKARARRSARPPLLHRIQRAPTHVLLAACRDSDRAATARRPEAARAQRAGRPPLTRPASSKRRSSTARDRRDDRSDAQLAFFAAIQASIFCSRIASGSAPVISTWAWNSRMSNLGPSSASALRRSRWMVIAPIL